MKFRHIGMVFPNQQIDKSQNFYKNLNYIKSQQKQLCKNEKRQILLAFFLAVNSSEVYNGQVQYHYQLLVLIISVV